MIERRVAEPMFQLGLFRIRAFAAGSAAGLIAATARGGLQFMLIIWLQGIWLPLHGYSYTETPLWAGIYLLPLTAAFLISGPVSGYLSDRFGARGFATAGMLVFGASFVGLMLLPVDFPYWAFALLIVLNGIGVGMFSAPNSSSIMSSVPARPARRRLGDALDVPELRHRAVDRRVLLADDRRPREQPAGAAARAACSSRACSHAVAHQIAALPPVSSLFAAVLGDNPVGAPAGADRRAVVAARPRSQQVLTGTHFFPQLISAPFHDGLVVVFSVAAGLSLLGALASLMRGGRAGGCHLTVNRGVGTCASPRNPRRPPTAAEEVPQGSQSSGSVHAPIPGPAHAPARTAVTSFGRVRGARHAADHQHLRRRLERDRAGGRRRTRRAAGRRRAARRRPRRA